MAEKISVMDSMKFVRYDTEFGHRYQRDNSDNFLMSLADFLLTEGSSFDASYWMRCINELAEGGVIAGNMMSLTKRGNNLYVRYTYDDSDNSSEPLEIPAGVLSELMVSWKTLMNQAPEEIVLTYDNGKFELIGKNVKK